MYNTRTTYLFVYGTLLEDSKNEMSEFLSKHSEFVGRGFFCGKLYDVEEFPGAVLSDTLQDKVYGKIYEISEAEKVFSILDDYEGIESLETEKGLFKRVVVEAFLEAGHTVKTWVYLYNKSVLNLRLISSGNYLDS